MRRFAFAVLALALAGCRGEPVPRDYQNAPPAMTHPADNKGQTPAAHGGGDAPPLPSTGNEGTAGPYEPVNPPTDNTAATTLPDTPPATTTT